jgi:CRISPR-associated protein (TIGR03986 family)
MAWPSHKSRPDTSIAPYNFVPLPEKVLPHPQERAEVRSLHDRFREDRHTGWIELTITTETPLYTRCAYDPHGPGTNQQHFFHHGELGRPVIPGSSLRGAIRALVEILGYGKVQMESVMDRRLFFRFLAAPSRPLRTLYSERMFGEKPSAGLLRRTGNGWAIQPAQYFRVPHHVLRSELGQEPHTDRLPVTPNWQLHQKEVWFAVDPAATWKVSQISFSAFPSSRQGILVITGPMNGKQKEYVFVPSTGSIAVDPNAIADLEDKVQLSQWQIAAFPRDQPSGGSRRIDGGLRDGEPVFYVRNPSGQAITALGRAQMFRLPFLNRTSEYVPEALRQKQLLDLAEAIFGTVGDKPEHVIKGRVSFEDAQCLTESPFPVNNPQWIPRILSSPKPTSFQHYLVQPTHNAPAHYDSDPVGETVIRGDKFYWHKRNVPESELRESPDVIRLSPNGTRAQYQNTDGEWEDSSQHTVIRPVRAQVRFSSRVHFENLTDLELGALLTALQLPAHMRHKLGMGKPLGMGSVRMETALHLSDRRRRYTAFLDTGEKSQAETEQLRQRACEAFAAKIIEHSGFDVTGLWQIPRLQALGMLLDWENAPSRQLTRNVPVEDTAADTNGQQWHRRKVLPTPQYMVTGEDPINPPLRAVASTPDGIRIPDPSGAEEQHAGQPGANHTYRRGDRVPITVVANENLRLTVELPDGSQLQLGMHSPLPPGARAKWKVETVDASGRIVKVRP